MAKAPIAFPPSAAELASMPNAELVQLVKQIESDHPQIKSLAHFMSKADKVAYIGALKFDTGAEIGGVIPAAEGKYADFLAKAKAKEAAAKIPTGSNCAATAMKDLETAVAAVAEGMPKLDVLTADIEGWFTNNLDLLKIGDAGLGSIQGFLTQLGGLDLTVPADVELANTYLEALKLVRNTVDHFPTADVKLLVSDAEKLKQVTPIFEGTNAGKAMDTLRANVNAKAGNVSVDYLNTNEGWQITAAKSADEMSPGELASVLHGYADLDPAQLTDLTASAVSQDILNVAEKLAQIDLDPFSTQALLNIKDLTVDIPNAVTDDLAKAALKTLANKIDNHLSETAWQAYKVDFEHLANVDLKKLAYQELDAHGLQKSLGSFLTKDEKVELLARFSSGSPVDELVAKAQDKYLAKEAASKAKKAGVDVFTPPPDMAPASTKAAEQLVEEAKADPASPSFDAVEAIQQAGEEHLAPADPYGVIETEPHPKAKVSHTFTSTGERLSGGSHPGEWFTDENGDRWIFKVQDRAATDIEMFATEVGERLGLDMAEMAPGVDVETVNYGVAQGTFQRAFVSKGELEKVYGMGYADQLTAEQVADLQRQQVLDWLISNHDSHGGNFLVANDGHLLPIDKGQTMKFFGTDKLNPTYGPNNSPTAYQELWKRVIGGQIKVNFDAIDEMLTRVEQMSDEEYRALVRAAVEQKYATAMRRVQNYMPEKYWDIDRFVDAAVERKQTIRADFEAFYRDVAHRAGIDWHPVWADDVAKAADIADPAQALAVAGDVSTPVTKTLAQEVLDTGANGRALHLAGEEINQGQALVWTETNTDGSAILRMDVRLERQADARVTKAFEDAAGGPPVQAGGYATPASDPTFTTIQKAAKTVNGHASDGTYNQAKIKAMVDLQDGLFKAIDAADAADAKLAKGTIDVDEWATLKSKGEEASHYKQVINDIQDGATFQHKVDHITEFDTDAAKNRWLAQAPKAPEKPVTKVEAPKLFEKAPTIQNDRVASTRAGSKYGERVRDGGYRQVVVHSGGDYTPPGEVAMGTGRQYEATMRVANHDIKVTWSSWNMTSSYSSKGRMTFEILNWDGDEAAIKDILEALQRLGVDSHLATVEEEKLTYWSVLTGQMKNSVEYARPEIAHGSYAALRDAIDAIEKRLAGTAMDTKAKIQVYREEYARVFGQDAVDNAFEAIAHVHDLHGNEAGYGYFERFDLPQDLRASFTKSGKQWGIARKSRIDPETFTDQLGSMSNSEKVRIGAPESGTSAKADLATGGGSGSFASYGVTGWQSDGPTIIFNPSSIARRGSTFNAPGDTFGRIWYRSDPNAGQFYNDTGGNWLNPSEWDRYIGTGTGDNTREIVARNGYSFYDDMEIVVTHSQAERDAILKTFQDEGVTELRGISIEDRVVTVRSNRELVDVEDRFFRAHPEAYEHRYSSPYTATDKPWTPQGTGTKAVRTPVTPSAAPVLGAAPGSPAAAKAGYEGALADFNAGKNSVASKVDTTVKNLKAAGLKIKDYGGTNGVKADFQAWWEQHGQYGGQSQVKAFKQFISYKIDQAEIAAKLESATTTVEKLEAIQNSGVTGYAKQAAMKDIFGLDYGQMSSTYYAEKQAGQSFADYLLQKATTMDVEANAAATAPAETAVTLFPEAKVTITPSQAQKLIDSYFGPNPSFNSLAEAINDATGQLFINDQALSNDLDAFIQSHPGDFYKTMKTELGKIAAQAPPAEGPAFGLNAAQAQKVLDAWGKGSSSGLHEALQTALGQGYAPATYASDLKKLEAIAPPGKLTETVTKALQDIAGQQAPLPADAELVFPKAGISLTPQQAVDVQTAWQNQVLADAIKQVLGHDIDSTALAADVADLPEPVVPTLQKLAAKVGAAPPPAAELTATGPEFVTVTTLGDISPQTTAALQTWLDNVTVTQSATQQLEGLGQVLGKDKADVLDIIKYAKNDLGMGDGTTVSDVVQEWVYEAKQAGVKLGPDVPAPSVSDILGIPKDFGTTPKADVPGLGLVSGDDLALLKDLLANTPKGQTLYTADIASLLGQPDAKMAEALVKAMDHYGIPPGNSASKEVIENWVAIGDQAKVIPTKAAIEVAPEPGDLFTATSWSDPMSTPFGQLNPTDMNAFTDAQQFIQAAAGPGDATAQDVADAIAKLGSDLGKSQSNILDGLDKVAQANGYPEGITPQNADIIMGKTVQGMGDAVGATTKVAVEAGKLDTAGTKATMFWDDATTAADVGKKVAGVEDHAEKVFTYNVNGYKVPVVFQKIPSAAGSNVYVKEGSDWYLLKPTSTGKTVKDEIIELLTKVGHQAGEPF